MLAVIIIGELIIPVILLFNSWALRQFPPQKPSVPKRFSFWGGYASKRAVLSEDTWTFAQEYSRGLYMRLSFILLVASVVALIIELWLPGYPLGTSEVICLIIIIVQIIFVLLVSVPVEHALKSTFTETGKFRKEPSKETAETAQKKTSEKTDENGKK